MMMRYAEQFLIRAEAEAHTSGDVTFAINDLNAIRNRAGLSNYTGATDSTDVLAAIMRERRVELFTENGHRWFDLKRTATIESVMGAPGNQCALKGGIWNPDDHQSLFPIANTELQLDHNIVQNPGY